MADALDSKSSTGNSVWVQVPPPARPVSPILNCNFCPEVYAGRMSPIKQIVAAVSLALFFVTPSVRAASATLEGIVKDANGNALQGAEIRIQGGGGKMGIVHTDARGHYAYPALETGMYQVSLVVNGTVKAFIRNVKTKVGETETLNFELQKGVTAKPFAKGKHYVWIPADQITGSHLGSWADVDDSAKPMPQGMQERLRWQGNSQVRTIQDTAAAGQPQ